MDEISPSTCATLARPQKAWIFQANPQKYHIRTSLKVEHEELWNLNQHAREVIAGDKVVIWICGPAAGIYALGTVRTTPITQSDSPTGLTYWIATDEGERPKARVWVRYDRVLLERPLLKVYLQADPALWNLSIIRAPRGTNFVVSESEWQALQEWFDNI